MQATPSNLGKGLPLIAALAALLSFIGLQIWAFSLSGSFEYPLDDPYIHLAMAKGILGGTYGVNPGEVASAASSILYPYLLLPFIGTSLQMFGPMAINTISVTFTGALWGGVLRAGGYHGGFAIALAVLGPLALNLPGVAYTGMEHELHLALALMIVLGLDRLVRYRILAWWFVLAVLLSPFVRLEGMALSVLALVVMVSRGRAWAAFGIGAALFGGLGAFMAYLSSLGLPPLPGSVMIKMGMRGADDFNLYTRVIKTMSKNLASDGGVLLAALTLLAAILPFYARRLRSDGRAILLHVAAMAGLAHLMLGQIGWMDRYEHYIIVTLIAALALSMGGLGQHDHRRMGGLLAIALSLSAIIYVPPLVLGGVGSPRGIHLQQAQMARFAHMFDGAVAVNDLGRVVLDSPNYVLDIFGLGSFEVLQARASVPMEDYSWLPPLLERHDIQVAMVYDHWFGPELRAAGWDLVGTLQQDGPYARMLGGPEVAFFAPPEGVSAITQEVMTWAKDLPEGASFTLAGTGEILSAGRNSAP